MRVLRSPREVHTHYCGDSLATADDADGVQSPSGCDGYDLVNPIDSGVPPNLPQTVRPGVLPGWRVLATGTECAKFDLVKDKTHGVATHLVDSNPPNIPHESVDVRGDLPSLILLTITHPSLTRPILVSNITSIPWKRLPGPYEKLPRGNRRARPLRGRGIRERGSGRSGTQVASKRWGEGDEKPAGAGEPPGMAAERLFRTTWRSNV